MKPLTIFAERVPSAYQIASYTHLWVVDYPTLVQGYGDRGRRLRLDRAWARHCFMKSVIGGRFFKWRNMQKGRTAAAREKNYRAYMDQVKEEIVRPVFWPPERSFEHYAELAYRLTELQPLHLVPEIEKRSMEWNLDHVLSVREAWERGLPLEVVADVSNLRIIHGTHNRAKGSKTVFTNLFNEDVSSPVRKLDAEAREHVEEEEQRRVVLLCGKLNGWLGDDEQDQ